MTQRITFEQLVNDKKLTDQELTKDLLNLKKFSADENLRCFAGNPFLYHYQMENLCKTRIKTKKTLYEIMNDDNEYKKLYPSYFHMVQLDQYWYQFQYIRYLKPTPPTYDHPNRR